MSCELQLFASSRVSVLDCRSLQSFEGRRLQRSAHIARDWLVENAFLLPDKGSELAVLAYGADLAFISGTDSELGWVSHTHTHTHARIHTYTHIHTHKHTLTQHIHTYTHTHTHTNKQTQYKH